DVLLQGSARSFPMEKHAPRIIEQQFEPGFRAQLMRKDLRLALDTARACDTDLAATPVAERLLDAMCNDGRGDWDWCGVALEVGKAAGKPRCTEVPRMPTASKSSSTPLTPAPGNTARAPTAIVSALPKRLARVLCLDDFQKAARK